VQAGAHDTLSGSAVSGSCCAAEWCAIVANKDDPAQQKERGPAQVVCMYQMTVSACAICPQVQMAQPLPRCLSTMAPTSADIKLPKSSVGPLEHTKESMKTVIGTSDWLPTCHRHNSSCVHVIFVSCCLFGRPGNSEALKSGQHSRPNNLCPLTWSRSSCRVQGLHAAVPQQVLL
jgi:hypothetical protein